MLWLEAHVIYHIGKNFLSYMTEMGYAVIYNS